MQTNKIVRFIVISSLVVAATGGYLAWRADQYVEVEISSVPPDARFKLARATNDHEPDWFGVASGKVSLKKGAYLFQIDAAEKPKVGLIAINDATPVVLK